jgi:phosphatidylglycerol:prolipoprotein diacylglycerol transferase
VLPFIDIGQVRIPSYPVAAIIAAAVSAVIFSRLAACRGMTRKSVILSLAAGLPALFLGAKLFNAWIDRGAEEIALLAFLAMPSGFSLYGAILGASTAVVLASRATGAEAASALDAFSVAASFGFAIGRVGCLLSGCCWGRPTLFPIALEFNDFNAAARPIGVPLHATQIYDMALLLAIGVMLLYIYRKKEEKGLTALAFFTLYPFGRFFLDFLRGNPRSCYFGLSAAQWTSAFIFISASLALLFFLLRHRKKIVKA